MKFRITLLLIGLILILSISLWDDFFKNYSRKSDFLFLSNNEYQEKEGCSLDRVLLSNNASEDILLKLNQKQTPSVLINKEAEKANLALTEGLNNTLMDMNSIIKRKNELVALVHNADIQHNSLSQAIDATLLDEAKRELVSLVSQHSQESISMKKMVIEAQASKSIGVKNIAQAMLKDIQEKKIDVLQTTKSYTLIKVKQGDTLVSLANRYYGNKKLYRKIYNVNKERVGQKMQIYANTIIMIPKGDS